MSTFKACFLKAELLVFDFSFIISIFVGLFWLFTIKNLFILLCKCLFTCLTTYSFFILFPSVTHYVFVKFLFIDIGLSTINIHIAGWLFEFG